MKLFIAFRRLSAFAVVVLSLVIACSPVAAQTSAVGNINGTVTDASGALVPNAPVVMPNTDTGVSAPSPRTPRVTTIGFLQPGHYEVILGGGAFGKVDRKNLPHRRSISPSTSSPRCHRHH